MSRYVPVFIPHDRAQRQRLMVCVAVPPGDEHSFDGIWGDPRPCQVDDLIGALLALDPASKSYVIASLGLIPEKVGERLEEAEDVLDALADAQLAIDRFRKYREKYPMQGAFWNPDQIERKET